MAQGLAKVSELENADSRTSRLPHCEAPAQGNLQILSSRKGTGTDQSEWQQISVGIRLSPNPGCWGPRTCVLGNRYSGLSWMLAQERQHPGSRCPP